MSTKYQPTQEDILTALAANGQRAMTLPDMRRAIQEAHNLPTTYRPSKKWAGDVAVNPISDAALSRALDELLADGVVRSFAVGEDAAVPTPYGTSPNSTLYLATADYRHRRTEWEEEQARKRRQRAEDEARGKAQATVLEKYADEVDRLAAGFLGEANKEN
jgi:hypothetical protein